MGPGSRIGNIGTGVVRRGHHLLTDQRMGPAMSSQKPAPKPPRPPRGAPISLDGDGTLRVNQWRAPARGATVQTIDGTGKRVTVTRLFVTGVFAFALKKKTGALSVVVCAADGDSTTVKVSAKKAQDVMAWAVAFNAWSVANG